MDFSYGLGTDVYAIADGTVRDLRENIANGTGSGFGNYVLIRHDRRHWDRTTAQWGYVYSIYAHLSLDSVRFSVGQHVTAGTWIAEVDDTGTSTGHHLHLQMCIHPEYDRTLANLNSEATSRNPELWLQPVNYGGTTGSVVGLVSDSNGNPVENLRVYGLNKPPPSSGLDYEYSETYHEDWANPDDILVENWGTTDVYPDTYHLEAKYTNGTLYEDLGWHTVEAGKTTYVGLYPVYLPDVMENYYGWNSSIVVRNNSDTKTAQVNTTFFWENGDVRTQKTDYIAPRGTVTVDFPGYCYYCRGSAVVVASQDVSVVVENEKDGKRERTNYTGILPGSPGSLGWEQAGSTLYTPAIKRQRYDRSSTIHVTNAGAQNTTVYVYYYDANGGARWGGSYSLSPNGRATIVPSGSGSGGCGASNTICSARLYSNNGQPLAGVVQEYRDADGKVVTTHNLFSAGATSIYFPIVKYKRYNMSTGLRIQNVGSAGATITVRFYRKDGAYQCSRSQYASSLAAKTFFDSTCPGDNFSGSAVATASQPLVGMANEASLDGRYKKSYSSFQDGSHTAYGPLVYRTYYQDGYTWDAGIAVQNLSTQRANVNLYYYHTNGNSAGSQTNQWIAPRGMGVFFAPQSGFKGSVLITADRDIAVGINVVNNAPSGDTHAIYNASNR